MSGSTFICLPGGQTQVCWNKSRWLFLLKQKWLTSYLYQTTSIYILGLDPKVIEQTKQNICESDCYIYEVFQAKTLYMILDILTPGDNLYFIIVQRIVNTHVCIGDFVRMVPFFMIVHLWDL